MSQVFTTNDDVYQFENGAWGHRSFLVGPFARVENCPITLRLPMPDAQVPAAAEFVELCRRTAYATSVADTFFSVPARVVVLGRSVTGYLSGDSYDGARFVAHTRHRDWLLENRARLQPTNPTAPTLANLAGLHQGTAEVTVQAWQILESSRNSLRATPYGTLKKVSDLLGFHGVESVRTAYTDEYAEYMNAGDVYLPTIIYFRGAYRVMDLGTFIERAPVKFV